MLALVQCHLKLHRIDAETLFRAAYMAKFHNDQPRSTLLEDVANFTKKGSIPQYVVDFMLNIVGKRKEAVP